MKEGATTRWPFFFFLCFGSGLPTSPLLSLVAEAPYLFCVWMPCSCSRSTHTNYDWSQFNNALIYQTQLNYFTACKIFSKHIAFILYTYTINVTFLFSLQCQLWCHDIYTPVLKHQLEAQVSSFPVGVSTVPCHSRLKTAILCASFFFSLHILWVSPLCHAVTINLSALRLLQTTRGFLLELRVNLRWFFAKLALGNAPWALRWCYVWT